MARGLVWSPEAVEDIESIASYIERDSVWYAKAVASSIKSPPNVPHKELFSDGGLSGEGHLKNGKRHGQWTFYYKSGGLEVGEWKV